jgi:hypothetical protein
VIGVAQATFAPEAKLANRAITDDSSSEAQVKKNTDSKNEEQSPNFFGFFINGRIAKWQQQIS